MRPKHPISAINIPTGTLTPGTAQSPVQSPLPAHVRVVVDSKETRPWVLPNSVRKGIKTGDYSLLGMEHESGITLERKSKIDCYLTISLPDNYARFKRELKRMAAMAYRAIIIESSAEDFKVPPPVPVDLAATGFEFDPGKVSNRLQDLHVKYLVPVFFVKVQESHFGGDAGAYQSAVRRAAAALGLGLLARCYSHHWRVMKGEGK
jgi:ERCC4-type nuclease